MTNDEGSTRAEKINKIDELSGFRSYKSPALTGLL
jgi:hypothetical protein